MALQFRLIEFGRSFATRGRGEELRKELIARVEDEDVAILDFSGVTNVSYSFADEFVGKLAAERTPRVESANMSAEVARSVERAVARRSGETIAC